MRRGEYFDIPETPDDVNLLRGRAVPIEDGTCPDWLDASDSSFYRYVGCADEPYGSTTPTKSFQSEIDELHMAGLLVCKDGSIPGRWRIYVTSDPLYDDWAIGIYAGDSPLSLTEALHVNNPVISRNDISDVQAAFVADPFMLQHENRWFMFFEILNWQSNKGEIGLATSQDGFTWKYEERVLVEPFHLSYPYVFCLAGEFYMMPETKQSGAVRLYRASEFPLHWSLVNTLLEGQNLVDSSIFCANDMWWILASTADTQGTDVLRLFMSDTIEGEWREHPESPFDKNVSSHVRPAGRVVVNDRKLFRVAQNSNAPYGTSVRAYEITRLTPSSYTEIPANEKPIMGPNGESWAASGMHHVDAHLLDDSSWLACVDGRP
jgi:hypothetical protein